MAAILEHWHRYGPWKRTFLLWAVLLAISVPFLIYYLNLEVSVRHLWLLLLPFILYVREPGKRSVRLVIPAIAMLLLYATLWKLLFLYLAIFFTLVLVLEAQVGKVNPAGIAMAALVSPVAKYVFDLFGFSIRLFLTEVAAGALSLLGYELSVSGSLITMSGDVFAVDEVCSGLRMVITGLLMVMVLISHFERMTKRYLNLLMLGCALALGFVLVTLANLVRIMLLIAWRIGEADPMHDVLGLGAIVLCVMVPGYFIMRWAVHRFGRNTGDGSSTAPARWMVGIGAFTYATVWVAVGFWSPTATYLQPEAGALSVNIAGYERTQLRDEVLRFQSSDGLVYIKSINDFYQTDHHPVLCWRGSGFRISGEQTAEVAGHTIMVAQLVGNGQQLHTAWWYSNGVHRTAAQSDWRWRMFKGEADFRLVNVTASSWDQLVMEVTRVMGQNVLATSPTS